MTYESGNIYKWSLFPKFQLILILCLWNLFPKFQLILILCLQVMHDLICVFHCYTDYCVELIIMYDNLCENWTHFILKWFQRNYFWNCDSYRRLPISKYLYKITEYTFKFEEERSYNFVIAFCEFYGWIYSIWKTFVLCAVVIFNCLGVPNKCINAIEIKDKMMG